MPGPILEVVVTSAQEAVDAVAGGANRLELATDMASDGLTPSPTEFLRVREAVTVPLRIMLRDRNGFQPADLGRLGEAAAALRAAGADAFVLGFLTPEGALDLPSVAALLAWVPGCHWTFHRALDHAVDRDALRRGLHGLPGLDTVLTAGCVEGVDGGLDVLTAEAGRRGEHGYAVNVMAGGGLMAGHLPVLRAHGLDAFHVGTSVRYGGWDTPIDRAAVARWRRLIEGDSGNAHRRAT